MKHFLIVKYQTHFVTADILICEALQTFIFVFRLSKERKETNP